MAMSSDRKEKRTLVVLGHADSGKSTLTGRFQHAIGKYPEGDLGKLEEEARSQGKESYKFAWISDWGEEERKRGVTMECKHKDFVTRRFQYTWIDTPGHPDYKKEMLVGLNAAQVAWVVVGASDFGEEQRRQTRFICQCLAGLMPFCVKKVAFVVNKMDEVDYSQAKYDQVVLQIKDILRSVPGWPKKLLDSIPMIPLAAFHGENLIDKSSKMGWWQGSVSDILDALRGTQHYLEDGYELFIPDRPVRMNVFQIYQEPGIGDVAAGRVVQGIVKPGMEVSFVGSHKSAKGKIYSMENVRYDAVEDGNPGIYLRVNVKGFKPEALPRAGDVMVNDKLNEASSFEGGVSAFSELHVGSTLLAFTGAKFAPCKITAFAFKAGPETGGKKVPNPSVVKAGEAAAVTFQPVEPFVVEDMRASRQLCRFIMLDEKNELACSGKVLKVEQKDISDVVAVFKNFDKDGSGSISKSELTEILKELDPAWTPESLNSLMKNADANSDGQLQIQEFVNWIFSQAGNHSTEDKEQMIDEIMAELEG